MEQIDIWNLTNAALDILQVVKKNYKFLDKESEEEGRVNFNDAYYSIMHWNNKFHDYKLKK